MYLKKNSLYLSLFQGECFATVSPGCFATVHIDLQQVFKDKLGRSLPPKDEQPKLTLEPLKATNP